MRKQKRGQTSRPLGWCSLLAVLLVAACGDDSGYNDTVVVRSDPTVDFTQYQTFAIVTGDMVPADEPLPRELPDEVEQNAALVSSQVRRQLIAEGLTEVQGPDPDADLFAFNLVSTEEEGAIVWDCVPGYWWGYWGWVWDNCAWLEPVYVEYSVGTIVVGLADPVLETVVFGGTIQGLADGQDIPDRIESGVARIFLEYPADQTGSQ